ncbi:MAG: 3-oxoacyl-ACP reductase FabG [bacterium]
MNCSKIRVALVAGGSRGIGRGIALALAESGLRVGLTYKTNRDLAEQVVTCINGKCAHQAAAVPLPLKAAAVPMDVENRSSIRKALTEVKRCLGPIDILVNNAAISQEKPFDSITDEDWDHMMAINLRGPFACCQEALPDMIRKGWGRIINISSIGGQWGGFNQVHYAAAKAGLINLTRSLARIYSACGITVNAVAPGLVDTDMAAAELHTPFGQEKVRNIPIGRISTVEEVAAAVVFLASEAAGSMSGQTLNVNGGMYFG